ALDRVAHQRDVETEQGEAEEIGESAHRRPAVFAPEDREPGPGEEQQHRAGHDGWPVDGGSSREGRRTAEHHERRDHRVETRPTDRVVGREREDTQPDGGQGQGGAQARRSEEVLHQDSGIRGASHMLTLQRRYNSKAPATRYADSAGPTSTTTPQEVGLKRFPMRALITGITGQDGLYLGELLLSKGYEVFGLIRGQSNPKWEHAMQQLPGVTLIKGDITDMSSVMRALSVAQPDEVYNLAAISFVPHS